MQGQRNFFYLSVVPDKKSPLSDIFILAPLAYKKTTLLFSKYVNSNKRGYQLLSTNLTDLHDIPSTTTNNESNVSICNANSYRVTPILLQNNTKQLVSVNQEFIRMIKECIFFDLTHLENLIYVAKIGDSSS